MKKILIFLLILIESSSIKAQITASYTIGYGQYSMSDMKDQLLETKSNIIKMIPDLDLAITDNFPNYFIHNLSIGYKIQKHELGLTMNYMNTAGKISYADYSGYISSETHLKGYRGGLYYQYSLYNLKINKFHQIEFYGELSPAVIYTKINIKQSISPKNELLNLPNFNYHTYSFSILPQIGAKINLISKLKFILCMGYETNLYNKCKELDRKINWSGIRINTGINMAF